MTSRKSNPYVSQKIGLGRATKIFFRLQPDPAQQAFYDNDVRLAKHTDPVVKTTLDLGLSSNVGRTPFCFGSGFPGIEFRFLTPCFVKEVLMRV
jgi:hypothetical protein